MRREEHSESNWENQISLFLDNQLSTDEKSTFIQTLQNNPAIEKWVEKEKKFRELLKSNFQRPVVSHDFEEKVKEKISFL